MVHYFFIFLCWVIALAYYFGKLAPVTAIMGAISLQFSTMYNALLHASGHSPADKIEERITFALGNARLYLSESDDKQDDKSAAEKKFDIFGGGGGSSYLL